MSEVLKRIIKSLLEEQTSLDSVKFKDIKKKKKLEEILRVTWVDLKCVMGNGVSGFGMLQRCYA